jgi:hypothetical protein
MTALQEGFDQEIYSVLVNIETVLINAANGRTFELNDAVKRLYKDDLDFDHLNGELTLLEGIISQRFPEVKTVTSIDTINRCSQPKKQTPHNIHRSSLQIIVVRLL